MKTKTVNIFPVMKWVAPAVLTASFVFAPFIFWARLAAESLKQLAKTAQ